MNLVEIAHETVNICRDGKYGEYNISEAMKAAITGTQTFKPGQLANVQTQPTDTKIFITDEMTEAAGRRLGALGKRVAVLNFASARNPGGGFLRGAVAQEEDLARKSGLYLCLEPHKTYYAENRAQSSYLYTDHLIYSPSVPFIRTAEMQLAAPVLVDVITSPAPNAGEVLKHEPGSHKDLASTLVRRSRDIFAVAQLNQVDTLVLGAWGCGVFRNNPQDVTSAFKIWVKQFNIPNVVFAIWDKTPDNRLMKAFKSAFENS